MDYKNEYKEFSLCILVAAVVRRLLFILIFAILTALLVSGVFFAKAHNESAEKKYKEKLEEYNNEIQLLNEQLSFLKELQNRFPETKDENYILDQIALNEKIVDIEKELSTIKKPAKPDSGMSIKYYIMGLFMGGLLSLIYVLVSFISSNPITLSFDAENRFGVPFMGPLFMRGLFFENAARAIIGERIVKDEQTAQKMIRNNVCNSFHNLEKGSKIAIVSSLADKAVLNAAEVVKDILDECGYSMVLISAACQNPDAVNGIKDSAATIILEHQWKSKWMQIASNTNLIKMLGKPMVGFILC